MTDKPQRGPGRPPAAPITIDPAAISELRQLARDFRSNPAKFKEWLSEERVYNVLFQALIAKTSIPGDRGIMVNAEASKRFMDLSEPLMAMLDEKVANDPVEDAPGQGQLGKRPRHKGRGQQRK